MPSTNGDADGIDLFALLFVRRRVSQELHERLFLNMIREIA
jgi:hypothetical protein